MKNPNNTQVTDREEIALFNRFDSIFRNNGYDPIENRSVSMSDALDLPNAAFMIPRVLTQFVQMGVEPLLVGSYLLQRLEYTPGMVSVFPSFDPLTAREVADGAGLPIFNINVGGGQTYGVNVRRHGLMLKIAKRFLEQSTYPWASYWLTLAGNALARHREEAIFNFITSIGSVVFDNDVNARKPGSTVQPIKGVTTGRNIQGKFNGSMTMDDIMDAYVQILMQGFVPDTLLIHPMMYTMWLKDANLRDFAMTAGGGSFFNMWNGNAAAQAYAGQYNYNGLGQGLGQTGKYTQGALSQTGPGTPQGLPQNQKTSPNIPSYLPLNFRILVSPFVRFDPISRTSDIMIFSSQHLGAMIVDEDPHVVSWEEKQFGIDNMAIQESYGFGILNEGQAIGLIRNVSVKSNEFILPARSYVNLTGNTDFQEKTNITNFGATPTDVLSQ